MYPDLLNIGPLTIRSYGTMVVIGFFAALLLSKFRIKRLGISWESMLDLAFYLLVAGIVGAKLLFWLIFPRQTAYEFSLLFTSPIEWIKALGGGFVFFGAVIGGMGMLAWYVRSRNLEFLKTMDFLAPSLALGHAIGRIGCFLAGCCYGKECNLPWAITFTHEHSLAPLGIPIHPTQLYESLFLFSLTVFLVTSEDRLTKIPGRLISIYVFMYSSWRFINEYFRADPRGSLFNGLMTATQAISLLGLILSVGMLIYLHLKEK